MALFDFPYYFGNDGRNYDVSPDGQRFLVIRNERNSLDDQARPEITVVLDWFEEPVYNPRAPSSAAQPLRIVIGGAKELSC